MRRQLLPSMFLLAIVLSSCGDGKSSASDSRGASTTTVKGSATPAKAGATPSGDTGQKACAIIRKVQGELRPDAVSAAYLAQFTISAASDEALLKSSGEEVDRAAKATCPDEHAKFLRQAGITSLGLN